MSRWPGRWRRSPRSDRGQCRCRDHRRRRSRRGHAREAGRHGVDRRGGPGDGSAVAVQTRRAMCRRPGRDPPADRPDRARHGAAGSLHHSHIDRSNPRLPLRQVAGAWPLHPANGGPRFRLRPSRPAGYSMHRRDKHTDKRAEPLPTNAGPPLGAAGAEDAYARGAMAGAADPSALDAPGLPGAPAVPGSPASHELEEQRDKYLRLAAEYDNYRKRTSRSARKRPRAVRRRWSSI